MTTLAPPELAVHPVTPIPVGDPCRDAPGVVAAYNFHPHPGNGTLYPRACFDARGNVILVYQTDDGLRAVKIYALTGTVLFSYDLEFQRRFLPPPKSLFGDRFQVAYYQRGEKLIVLDQSHRRLVIFDDRPLQYAHEILLTDLPGFQPLTSRPIMTLGEHCGQLCIADLKSSALCVTWRGTHDQAFMQMAPANALHHHTRLRTRFPKIPVARTMINTTSCRKARQSFFQQSHPTPHTHSYCIFW